MRIGIGLQQVAVVDQRGVGRQQQNTKLPVCCGCGRSLLRRLRCNALHQLIAHQRTDRRGIAALAQIGHQMIELVLVCQLQLLI